MSGYAGIKYTVDKNSIVNNVSIDGCYLNIENYKALPTRIQNRVYKWFYYLFMADHKDTKELELIIHTLHVQDIIVPEHNRHVTNTMDFVLVLNKIEDDIANEYTVDSKNSIIELLTDSLTIMHVAQDHFVFAYNTFIRYGYIKEKDIAKRLSIISKVINTDYSTKKVAKKTPLKIQN